MAEFNLDYPGKDSTKELKVKSGEIMFLVGPNGSGKSTLIHHFVTKNPGNVVRVTAHRQVWFNSNSLDLTPAARVQLKNSITQIDQQDQSKWNDSYGHQRSQAIIYDLIDSENVKAREIADAVRDKNMEKANELAKDRSPIKKMNDILRASNLHFQVIVGKASELVAVRSHDQQYSIAELSDGERNSLLIIANVLTAPKNMLILLDEPERHLHRSIVSPLISTLLGYREDCAFVVSTHDVTLPHDQKNTKVLILREYSDLLKNWDADYIDNIDKMDEGVSFAILGSRRVLLFVEGKHSSLDIQLYQILYPSVSIRALGSCIDVERTVKGIRAVKENHWILAYGIIDRDNRPDQECKELHKTGIIPLEQYSVESLYYHPSVIEAILNRIVNNTDDISIKMNNIKERVLEEVRNHQNSLVAKLVERKIKDLATRKCPDWKKILEGNVNITFSTTSIFEEEKKHISSLLDKKAIEKLMCRYPVRQTGVLGIIAQETGFKSKEKYEDAVRKMLTDDSKSLDMLRKLIAPVTNTLSDLYNNKNIHKGG